MIDMFTENKKQSLIEYGKLFNSTGAQGKMNQLVEIALAVLENMPLIPEKLPCDVHLDPGLILRKGVLVQAMLDALIRRDDYEKELAEFSEDERKARQEKISEFFNGLGE